MNVKPEGVSLALEPTRTFLSSMVKKLSDGDRDRVEVDEILHG